MSADTLATTGVPCCEDLAKVTPPAGRRARGPVVMVECFERIPCDPCHYGCRFGAIEAFEEINDIPKVDWEKCTGCGSCVAACPGLAIFVVDETASDTECLIAMPYEFSPLPAKGETVELLDRAGVLLSPGTVERVLPGGKPAGTPVVWVRAPKGLSLVARNLRRIGEGG